MKTARRSAQIARFAIALVGLFFCYKLTVDSAKTGVSRLLTTISVVSSKVESADAAIRLTPDDPEAHYTRALALVNLGRLPEATAELRLAIKLRPHHYYEWLDLGVTLDRLNDPQGAMAAFNESVRLAPGFAQPRWQVGNFLFRQEKYDEAFQQLRLGANSNPGLFESLLDLAWVATNGDVSRMDVLLDPQNTHSHLALANYLATHGRTADAARHVAEAGNPTEQRDISLLRETIKELVNAKQFKDAYQAWSVTHKANAGNNPEELLNGNFQESISQNDPGFGWQLAELPNTDVSIDTSGPAPNTRSIYFQFRGNQAPGNPLLSQLLLVQPNARGVLRFMTRVETLVTGGPPVMVVLDAGSQRVLGQSSAIPTGTAAWQENKVEFSTDKDTVAILIVLRRLECPQNPCPIFGNLWLSKFSLSNEKLQTTPGSK